MSVVIGRDDGCDGYFHIVKHLDKVWYFIESNLNVKR